MAMLANFGAELELKKMAPFTWNFIGRGRKSGESILNMTILTNKLKHRYILYRRLR